MSRTRKAARWAIGLGAAIVAGLGAVEPAHGQEPIIEFRGLWIDVWGAGFRNAAEVDTMIARAVQGRYNAIIPQVLAYHDTGTNSHGAYWWSNIVPRSTYVTDTFDPLSYMVQRAHANGLEIHPWIIPFRVSSSWPPSGNSLLAAHPEWCMVPRDSLGTLVPVGEDYALDPGSPDVQSYLISIVREIISQYAVDGIHWDYIRYTQQNAGYPASTGYEQSTLARFQRITGRSDVPWYTGDSQWDDFRRRTITEIVRRARAEIPTITTNPQQPLRHTAALIAWGNAPASFSSSSAWNRFQNWELWMRKGYLDAGVPMLYYDEDQYPSWYRNWVNAAIGWRYNRHMFIGIGTGSNDMIDSVTQIEYARSRGADGICTYDYTATRSDGGDPWEWYPYVAGTAFLVPAVPPAMPWRSPVTATEGTLYGTVTDVATGNPIDDAVVQVGALESVRTDANGRYAVTLIPAASGGTSYGVTAGKAGWPTSSYTGITVMAGQVTRHDMSLGWLVSIAADPTTPRLNQVVHFTPTVSLPAGETAISHVWHLGDEDVAGAGLPGPIDHAYDAIDDYVVTLDVVTAGLGTLSSDPLEIHVLGAPGDFDRDGDVDMEDFSHLQLCLSGTSIPQEDPDCQDARLDGDSDVDRDDVAIFMGCLSGSGVPAHPACAGE